MQRFVYAPKAYVYVKTDQEIYNLSDLVVSGNVSRKINQVSTAEVTIQNPYRQFTQPGNPTFRPMDRITIWLQRVPSWPIQCFTGYLDEAPYYQMYPGTCVLRASCTLKRLQYTYLDPGVPFTMAFLAKYGWISDGTGGIIKTNDSYSTDAADIAAAMSGNSGGSSSAGASDGGDDSGKNNGGGKVTHLSNGLVFPLGAKGQLLGGVAAHASRAWGNWQSDNALDIGCPLGTAVYAVDSGTVTRLTGSWDGTGNSNPNGFNVTLQTKDNQWFYTHMRYRNPNLKVGDKIQAGQYLGGSGAANGIKHLHIACMNGDPQPKLYASSTGSSASTSSVKTVDISDQKIFLIGDSIGVGIEDDLQETFSKLTSDTEVGRRTATGLSILKNQKSLPKNLIVSLGTNDFNKNTFTKNVNDIVNLPGVKNIFWINVWRPDSLAGAFDAKDVNQILTDAAAKTDKLHIIDAKSAVDSGKIVVSSADHIHPTGAGYTVLAKMVGDFVKANGGGDTSASSNGTVSAMVNVNADLGASSSVADLMFATLKWIGGWDPAHIYIDVLPKDLIEKIGVIYTALAAETVEADTQFHKFLKDYIGAGSSGSGGTADPSGDPTTDYSGSGAMSFNAVAKLAEEAGLPGVTFAQIAQGESTLNPNAIGHDPGGTIGYGLWQITSGYHDDLIAAAGGTGKDGILDPVKNVKAAKKIWDTQGKGAWYGISYVKGWDLHYKGETDSSATTQDEPSTSTKPSSTRTPSSSGDVEIHRVIDAAGVYGRSWHESSKGVTGQTDTSGHVHWHSGLDYAVPAGTDCIAPCDGEITMATLNWSDGGMIHFKFTEKTGDIPKGAKIGWGHIQSLASGIKVGSQVKGGQVIAQSGSSRWGRSRPLCLPTSGNLVIWRWYSRSD
jgi:murein DD-endopeptidase MepM/ murein hydrolase activator NlpD/lysophospholipase L1-like esterase